MKKLLQIQANQKHFTSSWLSSDCVPRHVTCVASVSNRVKDGPLENLWGVRAKYKKNIRAREN